MSHFTTVKTGLKDVNILKKVIERKGWSLTEAEVGQKVLVKGWEKRTYEADMQFSVGCSYGIGVTVEENGDLRLEADWWAIETFTEKTQQSIIDEITREYAYVTVMDKVHKLGYDVVEEKVGASQEVRILLRKWQ